MNQALVKHFKLSESDIAQIQGALLPHQTMLDVLFEKNMVDPVAYLAWAKDHYSLPVLKPAFLEQNNNVDALLDRYKNVFPRNVVPFHELDGVLYVMCLEPTPFDAPQAVQYVLAPYNVISQYNSKNESSVVTRESIEIPQEKENTNPLFKDLELSKEKKNPLDSFNFENLSVGDAKPQDAGPSLEDTPDIKLEEKQEIPAGLDFPAAPDGESSIVSENPVTSVDLNSFKFEGIVPAKHDEKAAPQAAPAPKPMTPFSASDLAAKHPPKPKVVPAEAAAPAPTATPPAQMPQAPKPIAMPASVSAINAAPAAPIAAARATGNAAPEFAGILSTMKKYFEKSMVLMFKNGNLEPHAWDEAWTKNAHHQLAIDTSTPSIFRIVNETLNPYHGHIVPNHINEAFFETWNAGQLPSHITICPIIHEKKIYGMILGTTTPETAKKFQLHHIQEIANDAFAMIRSSKAA